MSIVWANVPVQQGAVAQLFPSTFPSGQGSDFARVVEEVGAGLARSPPVMR